MKRLTLLLQFLLFSTLSFAQSGIIRGIVKLQNSGAKPLSNAQISAFGASPVYSNSSGMYEMAFNNKKPGATVSLMVSLDGFEVINDKEIERCVIRENPDDLIFIVMAKQGQRNKQALTYYNIIVGNTNQNYDKELKNINNRLNTLAADDSEREVLLKQIDALQKEKEGLLNQAEELAKQLATVDLDRASNLANEAYQKFQNGDVKAALTILDDATLDKSLKDAEAELERLQKKVEKADSAFAQSVENYMIKARFCISDGQYKAAYKNYLKAVEADSTNIENLIELANYCDKIHDQKRAIRFYEQALNLTKAPFTKANLTLEIGQQLFYETDFEGAEKNYRKGLEIAKSFIDDTLKYMHFEASANTHLTKLYYNLNQLDTAKSYSIKAFETYSKLANENPKSYESKLASLLLLHNSIFFNLGEFQKGIDMGYEAINILERLAEESSFYLPNLSDAYSNVGIMYARMKKFQKAKEKLLKSFEIKSDLADKNPLQYEPSLAQILGNLGGVYRSLQQFSKADSACTKALEIYKRLADENPIRFENNYASAYNNLSGVYHDLGEFDKEYRAQKEILTIRRKLTKRNPQRFNLDLVRSMINMVNLKKIFAINELDLKYKEEALELLKESKPILASLDSNIYQVQISTMSHNMFEEYFTNLTLEDLYAEQEIQKCISIENISAQETNIDTLNSNVEKLKTILESALKKYPNYQPLISYGAQFYGNLSWGYMFNSEFEEAEESARRGLEIDPSTEWIYSYLAPALLFQGKYSESKKLYLEFKDKPDGNSTYKTAFLNDLNDLESEGITHKDVEKIKKLLE